MASTIKRVSNARFLSRGSDLEDIFSDRDWNLSTCSQNDGIALFMEDFRGFNVQVSIDCYQKKHVYTVRILGRHPKKWFAKSPETSGIFESLARCKYGVGAYLKTLNPHCFSALKVRAEIDLSCSAGALDEAKAHDVIMDTPQMGTSPMTPAPKNARVINARKTYLSYENCNIELQDAEMQLTNSLQCVTQYLLVRERTPVGVILHVFLSFSKKLQLYNTNHLNLQYGTVKIIPQINKNCRGPNIVMSFIDLKADCYTNMEL